MRHLGGRRGSRFEHTGGITITFVATVSVDSFAFNRTRKSLRLLAAILYALGCGTVGLMGSSAWAEDSPAVPNANARENPYTQRIAAPPLEGGEWVNTAAPLALADLRGRF